MRSNNVDDPLMGNGSSFVPVVVGTVRRAPPDHAQRTTTLMGDFFFLAVVLRLFILYDIPSVDRLRADTDTVAAAAE